MDFSLIKPKIPDLVEKDRVWESLEERDEPMENGEEVNDLDDDEHESSDEDTSEMVGKPHIGIAKIRHNLLKKLKIHTHLVSTILTVICVPIGQPVLASEMA